MADNVGAHQRRTGVFEMLCAVRHVGSIPCVRRKLPRALRTMTAVYLQETAGRVRVRVSVSIRVIRARVRVRVRGRVRNSGKVSTRWWCDEQKGCHDRPRFGHVNADTLVALV